MSSLEILPRTSLELENWMKINCYNFDSYSINGNMIYEGFGLEKINERFTWYYTERGTRQTLKTFDTEEELIHYAFEAIKSDTWANSHCIGFTTSIKESKELSMKLIDLDIEFMQDQIPYYGSNNPVYRTFVFGCDCTRVRDLKKQYGSSI